MTAAPVAYHHSEAGVVIYTPDGPVGFETGLDVWPEKPRRLFRRVDGRRSLLVRALQIHHPFVVLSRDGERERGDAGDWLLGPGSESHFWRESHQEFVARYEQVPEAGR